MPEVLDEVRLLMETHGLRFELSGSSARKLRRGRINLLAGRAVMTSMFPLVSAEYSDFGRFPVPTAYENALNIWITNTSISIDVSG